MLRMTSRIARSTAMIVALFGATRCSRTSTVANVDAAPASATVSTSAPPPAPAAATASATIAAVDAAPPAKPADRWVTLNDPSSEPEGPRVGGVVVHPEIELPARATDDGTLLEPRATILAGFPFVALRRRGLPAVSADGTRIAHVYGQQKCCRGPGYVDFTLYVFDAKTGAVKNKLLLWTVDDERRIPEGTSSTDSRVASYEAALEQRARAARAALEGEWTTLASLVLAPNDVPSFRGEGLDIRLASQTAFPPISVTQGSLTKTFPSDKLRVASPRTCPPDSITLQLAAAYTLPTRRFALVDTRQGVSAPDGCEGGTTTLLVW